ncbi:hypothetical protein C0Q70_05704 [Pomacea canaliculata]|uniref:Uncharacterized protein n=1 Tax=Pomacea canaliculata TaxID=400727 RepID=A0A2T7PLX8_POMCA|nr:hypothetical protein C0Q70_05704 [Pomacea canaliculata]
MDETLRIPDLWVIAVNPHNDTVRSDLHQTLSSAATAFLSHRDFSVVGTMRFRRMSGCDIVICFQDEELTLCTRTGQLKQCADVNKTPLENFSAKKAPARIKKNRQAVEVATQTSNSDLESYDDDCDENDEPSLQAEEPLLIVCSLVVQTDVERGSPDDLYTKYTASESASLANSGSDCDSTRGTYHQTVTRIQSTMDTTMQPLAPHSTASTDLQNHCLTSAFPRR